MDNKMMNPYQPPKSAIETHDIAIPSVYFFTTSTRKLVWMSICTFGIYQLYWFYKNWVLIKQRTGQPLMPFWRAFFSAIWAYSCFRHIKTVAVDNNFEVSLPIGFLALTYFVLGGMGLLPNPYWVVSFLSFIPLLPVNNLALTLNKQLVSGFQNNEEFTGWNWVALILGGSYTLLIILLIIFMQFGILEKFIHYT